jgi:LytR cell envelope-related transcriptional attenuator
MTNGSPRKKIGRWVVLAGTLLVAAGSIVRIYTRSGLHFRLPQRAAPHIAPGGPHVRVEVLNATDTKGLARAAMCILRDAGFDVVFFGNTAERVDTTQILDRSGHADWAQLAARAMLGGKVQEKPDSSRFLDLSVLVGRNWTPPPEPLCP